jgi:hypothetical protein
MYPASYSAASLQKGCLSLGETITNGKATSPLTLKTGGGELIAEVNRQLFNMRRDEHLDIFEKGEGMVDLILTSLLLVLYGERSARNS